MAADKQGKFWPLHDKLFASQPKIQHDDVLQYAREVGLDMKKFNDDLYSPAMKATIDADVAEGKTIGVSGTPAFFVNGHFLSGAKPFDEFAQVINAELTRLKLPVPPAASKPGTATGG